jgi:hypothetical protein
MEEKITPAKSALSLGILFGAIMILQFVVMYILDPDPIENKWMGVTISLLNYLMLPVLFIVLGSINYKNKINEGFINFSDALKIGVSIMAIAALAYSVFYIIFNLIFPEYIDQTMEKTAQVMRATNNNMTDDQIDMAITVTRKFSSPWVLFPVTMAIYCFLGLLYSLIVGAIVKNPRP